MPSVTEYRRQMLEFEPALGRVVPITSLATGSVTVNVLRFGGVGNQMLSQKWLVRPEATNVADRVRFTTDFAPATGVLAHSGANYVDTTATDEEAEILDHQPYLYDQAVNRALRSSLRVYRGILPSARNQRWYSLKDFDWIKAPGDVIGLRWIPKPVLSRNDSFEYWSTYSASSVLLPDFWTLAGSGATLARSSTGALKGQYTAAITRSTNNVTLSQTPGLLWNGVPADSLRGVNVTAVLTGTASSATQLRVSVTDGVDTSNSSYHSGGGAQEELTASHTVNSAATTLTISVEVNGTDGTAYADRCYLVYGELTDNIRRDDYEDQATTYPVEESVFDTGGGVMVTLPPKGLGGQFHVLAGRPYPVIPEARRIGDQLDADASDAPLDVIAAGALEILYRGLSGDKTLGDDRGFYGGKMAEWKKKHDELQGTHTYASRKHDIGGGMGFPPRQGLAPVARR